MLERERERQRRDTLTFYKLLLGERGEQYSKTTNYSTHRGPGEETEPGASLQGLPSQAETKTSSGTAIH